MGNRQSSLLSLYELFPFHDHPFWRGLKRHEFHVDQIIRAEVQHWLRTRAGQTMRRDALNLAQKISPAIFELLLETYLEECTNEKAGPSHLELIRRLVIEGGVTDEQLASAAPTPGNAAAIALYKDIGSRGAGCHMLGAGVVEFYYCKLAPQVFEIYTEHYGMSATQAETYRIHGPMDAEHAERAFTIIDEAVTLHGWTTVEAAVRDAFVATSLHYDGMLQAATGQISFWNGEK